MHWETKRFVTRFVEIFASLWWSGTDPAISLRYACVYFCQLPRGTANFSSRSLQCCCCLYITQRKWIWLTITNFEGRKFCFLYSGVDTAAFLCVHLSGASFCFSFNFTLRMNCLGPSLLLGPHPSSQAPASLEGSVVLGYKVVRLLWGKPFMVSLFGFWPLWNCATCMRSTVFFKKIIVVLYLFYYTCFIQEIHSAHLVCRNCQNWKSRSFLKTSSKKFTFCEVFFFFSFDNSVIWGCQQS